MFWHKTQRSPSPPRLTSSIPEMERHLATMDSATSAPTIDKVDRSSVMPEDISAMPNQDQDQGKAPAVGSSDKSAMEQAQPQAAVAESDLKASISSTIESVAPPKPKLFSVICSKAQRSRPCLLVLVTCVSYLLFQSLGIGFGLRLINGYAEPRHQQAGLRLQAAWSDLARDSVVSHKLDELLGTTMERRYQESYEACLARGLYIADNTFLGVDFTLYPDARERTMDWVMDNCDRLHYTPAVVTPDVSKLLAMVNRLRKSAEDVLELFKHRITSLRSKVRGDVQPLAAEQSVLRSNHNTTTSSVPPQKMPFGFSLDCEGRARCGLTCSGPYRSLADETTTLEIIANSNKKLHQRSLRFKKILHVKGHIIYLLTILQFLSSICYLGVVRMSSSLPLPRYISAPKTFKTARVGSLFHSVISNLTHDEKLALGFVVNTALYALLHYEFDFITSEFDLLLFPVGLGFCAFHTPQAIAFFVDPNPDTTESLLGFCRAAHQLYLISRGDSVPDSKSSKECCPFQRAPAASAPLRPASKIGARFISPLTSISEDLHQERQVMHAEQGKLRNDIEPQYGYATETDSEYDSDDLHASYVDLTGGATPTVFDDAEEWAVVEE